jgi:hypothetical protein
MDRASSTHGENRNAHRTSMRKPKGKRPLGRPRRNWEDGITICLREAGRSNMEWISLAQDRAQKRDLVYAVMDPRFV